MSLLALITKSKYQGKRLLVRENSGKYHGSFGRVFQKIHPLKERCPGGWASGVGHCPKRLTFFQSYTLPLSFSGLLSYLVGMKRRTIRRFTCKRVNSHILRYLKTQSIMPLGIFLDCQRICMNPTCLDLPESGLYILVVLLNCSSFRSSMRRS